MNEQSDTPIETNDEDNTLKLEDKVILSCQSPRDAFPNFNSSSSTPENLELIGLVSASLRLRNTDNALFVAFSEPVVKKLTEMLRQKALDLGAKYVFAVRYISATESRDPGMTMVYGDAYGIKK